MDPRLDPIQREIDATREALGEKLDAIEDRFHGGVASVRQAVDVRHQVARRPWLAAAAAAAVGFAATTLAVRRRTAGAEADAGDDAPRPAAESLSHRAARAVRRSPVVQDATSRLKGELRALAAAAVAVAIEALHENVRRRAPRLAAEAERFRHDGAPHAG